MLLLRASVSVRAGPTSSTGVLPRDQRSTEPGGGGLASRSICPTAGAATPSGAQSSGGTTSSVTSFTTTSTTRARRRTRSPRRFRPPTCSPVAFPLQHDHRLGRDRWPFYEHYIEERQP